MIVTLTQLSQTGGSADSALGLSIIVFVLLLALLIQHEILRCFVGPRSVLGRMALQVIILPLSFAFAGIALARLATLLSS
jgi:hypothetical protein